MSAERDRVETFGRLEDGLRQAGDWYLWGPYLSERQWGTVREDYSPGGTAWDYLPHDHARSRAYRWGEDGLAGFSDVEQRLCLGLALWNGRDPILKERIFGLTGEEGNHGEDAKEYWWYLDALPSHAWNRWRYHYPQAEFPYADLVAENARRGKLDPEYELLDTGAFDDDRYWIVEADYAKGDPHDLLLTVRVTNAGPEADTLHVLPTAWYRNTWAWGLDGETRPELRLDGAARLVTEHPFLGELELVADGEPKVLFCENETNDERLFGAAPTTAHAEGRDQRPRRLGRGDRRDRRRDEGRVLVPASASSPARRPRSGCGSGPPAVGAARGRTSTTSRPSASRRPTSSTPSSPRPRRAPTRPSSSGSPWPGCSGASSSTPTTSRAGSTATRPSRGRPTRGSPAATRTGGRSTPSTSCRCPTSGSTRGSPPGISPSTASRSPASTRRSPSTS